jgi:hypothetical protein
MAPFDCPYCGAPNEVPATLAGCVTSCTACHRDLVAPLPGQERRGEIRRTRSLAAKLGILAAAGIGGIVGWLLVFVTTWASMLNTLGVPAAAAYVVAALGSLLVALFSGLLAYWAWPDPPLSATPPRKPLVVLSIVTCASVGAVVGALLLFGAGWFYALSVIGIGLRHAAWAALAGALMGSFLGGLLGYSMCQE